MESKHEQDRNYYAYWTHDWDADFHPFIDKVADIGFDILEVNAGTIANMTHSERQSLKSHAADRGITLSYCIGLTKDHDPASEDIATRQGRGQIPQTDGFSYR